MNMQMIMKQMQKVQKDILNNYRTIDIYQYQKINHKMTNLYRLERKG